MSEQKVQAKGDEFTDTMGEVYPFYNQQPWQIADDWGQMNLGQRLRYGFSHGLEQFGGWPGAILGQAMRLPVAHMFRKMFGKGGNKSGGMNIVGPDGQRYPFGGGDGGGFPAGFGTGDWLRTAQGGGQYTPPGGWGSGYGVVTDPTRPMTPGMAGFLGAPAGGMTNPFGYSTGGWEDAVIAGRMEGVRPGRGQHNFVWPEGLTGNEIIKWREANPHLKPKWEGEGAEPDWFKHYWGGGGGSKNRDIPKY